MHDDFAGDQKGYDILAKEIGHDLVGQVWSMNDNGKSWEEIADFLQEKGY